MQLLEKFLIIHLLDNSRSWEHLSIPPKSDTEKSGATWLWLSRSTERIKQTKQNKKSCRKSDCNPHMMWMGKTISTPAGKRMHRLNMWLPISVTANGSFNSRLALSLSYIFTVMTKPLDISLAHLPDINCS